MQQYLDLLKDVLQNGVEKEDRTSVGTYSVFGRQLRFNLEEGFPLVTTKKLNFHAIAQELLWFISGSTNINDLKDNGVRIWNAWADENGELGPVYGKQWRSFGPGLRRNIKNSLTETFPDLESFGVVEVDQLAEVIAAIRNNPDSRRHIVTAWNPVQIPEMALPPCHMMYQFYVANGKLSCQMYQRSCDLFLGVPFNIASYALLTMMIAQITNLAPGEFIHTFGDAHIYKNHLEQVNTQLAREPRPLPKMLINPNVKEIDDFKYEDFQLTGYNPHPIIRAEVAV